MEPTVSGYAPPRLWIESATFSDGTTISFSPIDIVVFVGPNNSGKSVALRNLEQKVRDHSYPGVVVTTIEIKKEGDVDSLLQWLEKSSRRVGGGPLDFSYSRLGVSIPHKHVTLYWKQVTGLGQLAPFFIYHLTTEARLTAANPTPSIKLSSDPFSHPIHYLQRDDYIENRISGYFRQAFGQDLIVHRDAGKEVPLHCGEKPSAREGKDRHSIEYIEALEQLPTLHSQGDGMRSFVGVLLHSLVAEHSVLLIDEPEAFLHPPQARFLGRMLVEETPENRQLFMATHSGDFLRGLLDVNSARVKIIRIQRDENVNPIKELDNSGIRKVWSDPILRYSNVLDGLFHEKVVVCESDADCRFYAAIMDADWDGASDNVREDIMFLHCGGKSRIPVVVGALRNLDVPVKVISDFDVLNSQEPLRKIYEELGGEWAAISADWNLVKSAINQKKLELDSTEVSKEIEKILKNIKDSHFPKDATAQIKKILSRSSPWANAKSVGRRFVPPGDPTIACDRLFEALHAKGLFVVPVGELEGFDRSVGGHGPSWVNEVLSKDLAAPEFEEAGKFVRLVLS